MAAYLFHGSDPDEPKLGSVYRFPLFLSSFVPAGPYNTGPGCDPLETEAVVGRPIPPQLGPSTGKDDPPDVDVPPFVPGNPYGSERVRVGGVDPVSVDAAFAAAPGRPEKGPPSPKTVPTEEREAATSIGRAVAFMEDGGGPPPGVDACAARAAYPVDDAYALADAVSAAYSVACFVSMIACLFVASVGFPEPVVNVPAAIDIVIQEGAYFLHCAVAVAGDAARPPAQLEIAESQYLLQTSMALSSKVSRGALGWDV